MFQAIQIETQSQQRSTLLRVSDRPGARAESLRFTEENSVSIKARSG
jgi:hypothetical protein